MKVERLRDVQEAGTGLTCNQFGFDPQIPPEVTTERDIKSKPWAALGVILNEKTTNTGLTPFLRLQNLPSPELLCVNFTALTAFLSVPGKRG